MIAPNITFFNIYNVKDYALKKKMVVFKTAVVSVTKPTNNSCVDACMNMIYLQKVLDLNNVIT